jgi:hypothetical protein
VRSTKYILFSIYFDFKSNWLLMSVVRLLTLCCTHQTWVINLIWNRNKSKIKYILYFSLYLLFFL